MAKEYSFAGVRSKALWFPYPLSPNNVTYASYYFIAIPFFETFFFIQNGIPRFRHNNNNNNNDNNNNNNDDNDNNNNNSA